MSGDRIWSISLALLFLLLGPIFAVEKPICESCACQGATINCKEKILRNLPTELSSWPANVEVADFSSNMLTRVEKLPKLDRLYSLSFRHNLIWGVANSSFADLEQLEELDLGYNQLSSLNLNPHLLTGRLTSKGEFDPLKNLRVLKLDYNTLQSLQSVFFMSVPYLTEVYLGGNPIRKLDESTQIAVASLGNLQVLDLSYASLSTLPAGLLGKLARLRALDLSGNQLASVPSELKEVAQLRELRLSGNPFRVLNEGAFPASLASLQTLVMADMGALTRVGARSMAALTGLRALLLTGCRALVDIHEHAFKGTLDAPSRYPSLRTLILRGNALTTLSSGFLPRGDDLEEVDLRDNQWMCRKPIKWFITHLEPIIAQNNPEYLQSVTCAGPSKVRGLSVFSEEAKKSINGGNRKVSNFIVPLIMSSLLIVVFL